MIMSGVDVGLGFGAVAAEAKNVQTVTALLWQR
jgi:hypothetical protein